MPRLIPQCSVASPHPQGLPLCPYLGQGPFRDLYSLGSRIRWGESKGFMLLVFSQGAQAASPSRIMPGLKIGVADEGIE